MQKVLIVASLIAASGQYCFAEIILPPEISNIQLGMSTDALLAARPAISRSGWMDKKIDLKKSDLILYETLSVDGSIYSAASYEIKNGQLHSFTLNGYPKKGEERAVRRKAIKDARQKWGKAQRKLVSEDVVRQGKGAAAFIWQKEGHEIYLLLPVNREKGDSKVSPVSIQIRPFTGASKKRGEMPLNASARNAVLKDNDADDMETPE